MEKFTSEIVKSGIIGVIIFIMILGAFILGANLPNKSLEAKSKVQSLVKPEYIAPAMWRYKVYKGWLIKTTTSDGIAMIYIEDEKHYWKLTK